MSRGEQVIPQPASPFPTSRTTLRQRVWKGLGANAFGQLITIGTQLLSLPFFLHYWSVREYGIWLLISAVPAYFSLADVGIGTVAMNRMTMLAARGNIARANQVFQTALVLTLATTATLFVVALAIIWSIDMGPVQDNTTRLTLSLLITTALVGIYASLFDGVFRASGRFATGTLSIHLVRLAEWMGGMAGLILYGSMLAVAAGALAARLVTGAALVCWAARLFPQFRWRTTQATRADLREMLPSAAAFLALPVGNTLLLQGMTIVVGSTFGPVALAVFSTCRTLSRFPVQLLTMFSRSLWPEISRCYGAGDLGTLNRIYHHSARTSLLVCTVACIMLYVASPMILRFWSQDRITTDWYLLALFSISALTGCAWQIEQVVLSATNTHMRMSFWYLSAATLVVTITAVIPAASGLAAVAGVLIVFELIMFGVSKRLVTAPLQGGSA